MLGIKYLQSFCKLNEQNLDTINELFVAAVIKMHDTWIEMNKLKKVNVMQFNIALLAAGDLVIVLLAANHGSILELKRHAFA